MKEDFKESSTGKIWRLLWNISFFNNPFASDALLLKVREVLDKLQREKESLKGLTETRC